MPVPIQSDHWSDTAISFSGPQASKPSYVVCPQHSHLYKVIVTNCQKLQFWALVVVVSVKLGVKVSLWKAVKRDSENICWLPMTRKNFFLQFFYFCICIWICVWICVCTCVWIYVWPELCCVMWDAKVGERWRKAGACIIGGQSWELYIAGIRN